MLAPDLPLVDDSATPNLIRIDPATNEVTATIPLPDRLCQGFTAREDAIWACAAGALIRIDPATNEITDTVPITRAQHAYRPAAGAGYLWFLGSGDSVADTVLALDTGAKSTRPFMQSGTVGGMAFAFDALWLTIPATNEIVETITSDEAIQGSLTVAFDSIWTVNL